MAQIPTDRDITASNSLTDLAARIRQEHEGVAGAMKRGLEHAINAGRLLIEAKAQLAHGQWLPWLQEHCRVPERSASRYMHLARHAPELEQIGQLADLTMTGAIDLLAPPSSAPDWDNWDDISEWLARQLDGPFNGFDFPAEGDVPYDWVATKLRHQAKLPWIADWCFSVADATEDGRPALRLCPWDDLLAAAKALAPIASGDRALKVDFADIRSMQAAITVVKLDAMWMLGGVLREIEYREKITEERYEREWEETHSAVMARIQQQIAEGRS